jgi:mono/diheme cytochrome c family protein
MLFVFIVLPITLTKCGEANDTVSLADSYMADPEAVKRGRLLFVGTCAGYCHKLTPERLDALYLFDCEWKHGSSDQAIFDIVTTGVPNTRMVGFGTNFPEGENDLWKIIAFIRTNSPQCA